MKRFFMKYSGVGFLLIRVESFILRYRLCIRMTPISYKVFLWSLGVIFGGSSVFVSFESQNVLETILDDKNIIIEQALAIEIPEKVKEIEKWEIAEFTSYSAGDGFTPGTVMASGRTVYVGAIACPSRYAFGTVVEVRGVGMFTCEDRMAKRFRDGSFFDIYADSVDTARQFGRLALEYRIIEK